MPKRQLDKPLTISDLAKMTGGKKESAYSAPKPKKDKKKKKKKKPTSDLSIGGAVKNIRERIKKNESPN